MSRPVMEFFEEKDHVRIVAHYPHVDLVRYLSKADAVQMLEFIGSKSFPATLEENVCQKWK